jgi:peptidoglycan/xylan/chitin deacetylase (PgdA/CDA1 family)
MKCTISLLLLILLSFSQFLLPSFSASAASSSVDSIGVSSSCNCVAFRLDDIQDYFMRDAQKDLIRMFVEENVTLTIGVIGGFLNNDTDLIHSIQGDVNTGLIEVANHGWVHTDHSKMTYNEQLDSILKTNKQIKYLFGVDAKTFIPPENPFNNDTLSVMRATGLTHLSGSIFFDSDAPPYPFKDGDAVFHFPQTAYVSDVDAAGVWKIFPNDKILAMIKSSVDTYGFAVVSMHPVAYYNRQGSKYIYNQESLT